MDKKFVDHCNQMNSIFCNFNIFDGYKWFKDKFIKKAEKIEFSPVGRHLNVKIKIPKDIKYSISKIGESVSSLLVLSGFKVSYISVGKVSDKSKKKKEKRVIVMRISW